MAPKTGERKPFLPDTFWVTFFELASMSTTNLILCLTMYYIVWPNEKYNEIFNEGFGPFHGWKCGDTYPNSGRWILLSGQASACCLYLLSLIFLCLDYYLEKHGKLQDYKVAYPAPRPKQTTINWRLYRKSIWLARINAIFSFLIYPLIFIPLMEWRGNCDNLFFFDRANASTTLSYDIFIFILKLLVTNFAADIIFYVTHRLNHEIGFLYRNVHKMHHEFVDTYGISATASHPFEHLFVNLSTVLGAPIVSGLPLIPYFIFTALASIQTTFAHCGYGNPFRKIQLASATPHDFHHHYQNCEFGNGANGVCDTIFKTRLKDIHPKRWDQMRKDYGLPLENYGETKKKA